MQDLALKVTDADNQLFSRLQVTIQEITRRIIFP